LQKITNNEKNPIDYLREGFKVPELCGIFEISRLKFFSLYKADLILFIKELVTEGKTRREIAKLMGINIDSVKKLKKMDEHEWNGPSEEQKSQILELSKAKINPKGIRTEMSIPIDWVYNTLKNEILLTYVKTNLQTTIERYGMDARTLTKIIESEGFIIPSSSLALRIIEHYGEGEFPFDKAISNTLKDKIIGELMGDGHIRKNRDTLNSTKDVGVKEYKEIEEIIKEIKEAKSIEAIHNLKDRYNLITKVMENVQITSFELHKGVKEFKWAEYMEKVFKEDGYETSLRKNEIDCYCSTQSSIQLQEMRDKWYKDGVKILPEDFKINPTIMLHWYEGDGSYGRKENRINFSTHNFTENEVRKLRNDITQELVISPIVTKETKRDFQGKKYPGEYYYLIYINRRDDVEKFFQYLDKADKESVELAKKTVPHKFPNHFLP
jgi:hypothetical protein